MLGLGSVCLSFFLIQEGNQFPGYGVLLPVLGTGLVIASMEHRSSPILRFLGLPPLAVIGRMSYSLYLCHWPIFSFVDYRMLFVPDATRLVLKIGLSGLAAAVSFLLIEKPSRGLLNRPRNRRLAFAGLFCAIGILAPLGIAIRKANYVNATLADAAKGGLVFNGSGRRGKLILMGDSDGSMYGRMMVDVAEELDYKIRVLSVAAEDPLPRVGNSNHGQLWADSLATVKRERPDFLVMACNWSSTDATRRSDIELAVRQLSAYCARVILLTQPPILPVQASREAIRQGVRPPFLEDQATRAPRTEANEHLRHLAENNVTVLDVEPRFLTQEGYITYLDKDGRQLYHDRLHLSGYGAELVKADVMRAIAGHAAKSRPEAADSAPN